MRIVALMMALWLSASVVAQEPSAEAQQITDLKAEMQILRDTAKTSESEHARQVKALADQLASVRAQIPPPSLAAQAKDARKALKAECASMGMTFTGVQITLSTPATATRPATPRTVVLLCQ